MYRDARIIKALNFNSMRCAHYPNHPRWYEICDEVGLFLVDEANIETHGFQVHPYLSMSCTSTSVCVCLCVFPSPPTSFVRGEIPRSLSSADSPSYFPPTPLPTSNVDHLTTDLRK